MLAASGLMVGGGEYWLPLGSWWVVGGTGGVLAASRLMVGDGGYGGSIGCL